MDLFEEYDRKAWSRDYARTQHPDTSKDAAKDLLNKGLGSAMRRALVAVQQHGGKTSNEIEENLRVRGGAIRKRLNDLRKTGCVAKGEPRPCRVTGRNAHPWTITPLGRTYLVHSADRGPK